jgi:CheY-like chemotaxis protein
MSHLNQGDMPQPDGGGTELAKPRARVLCVDDEQNTLAALARVLRMGFEVLTSQDAAAALSLLERDGNFAVVIADLGMPRMGGVEFLRRVAEQSPLTTRLVLTGAQTSAVPPGLAFRILAKPYPSDALEQAVLDAAAYYELNTASPVQPVEAPRRALWPSGPDDAAIIEPPAPRAGPEPIAATSASIVIRDAASRRSWQAVTAPRMGLRLLGRIVELLPGATLLGRSRSCHIPVDDPKVSRRHACFTNYDGQLAVRNLSSTNPLLLRGSVLDSEPHQLAVGDRLSVCGHEIEVCLLRDYVPSLEPTERVSELPIAGESLDENAATLGALGQVATKYLRLGQCPEAERILRPLLDGLLRHCRAGLAPLASDLELAVHLTLEIAEAGRNGGWISYLFELLGAVQQPPAHAALERLYRIVPVTPGISMTSYRGYLDILARAQERYGPAQQFLVRRVQGLEAAILRSAHV